MKFFKHLKNVIAFNQLDVKNRQIVFYSEGKNYWVHLKGLVEKLLEQGQTGVCYVSSGANDPGLAVEHENYHSFLIDEGWVRNWWFENLKADLLVLSMPDIHQYQVKRSKFPVHYVYVQHSLVSKHMVYRKGAFDYYDSIFCAGPHHIKEIKAIESLYKLPEKALYKHGYSRLDSIIKNASRRPNKTTPDNQNHVLIAPSWGQVNVVEEFGLQIVEDLLNNGFKVTLRPHPQTIKFSQAKVAEIVAQFKHDSNFSFEGSVDGEQSLHQSDVMISDWSGAALDYAFGLGKPVLFIDVPRKVNNAEYEKIDIIPFEDSIRTQIGEVMPLHEVANVSKWIRQCLAKKSATGFDHGIYNVGCSDQVGADLIVEILEKVQQAKSMDSNA
ncbi:CDP-glycerol glycerophosphotransferase family protein [Marinicella litoralis]|uniref:CDP-glycerol:poly(Glycerophosphate) glycerophosphotransferase n=1 Tax=Marinicella litoralis TaxID=644220 RepID=A0A4V3DIR4_9GAMM|nr:CDP-glycerol glycerophosphotransferase family protein [Marinicella litoralis]TDR23231.1 CDP-glycerol:poly(glycerophosphate) glycerophosphotransferase [Marinicella litoralis]